MYSNARFAVLLILKPLHASSVRTACLFIICSPSSVFCEILNQHFNNSLFVLFDSFSDFSSFVVVISIYSYLFMVAVTLKFLVIDVCSYLNMKNFWIDIEFWLRFSFATHSLANQMFVINSEGLERHFVYGLACDLLSFSSLGLVNWLRWDPLSSAKLGGMHYLECQPLHWEQSLLHRLTNAFWILFALCVCKRCLNLRNEKSGCERGLVQLFCKLPIY